MAMPLELFSTESAYYLFAERPAELNESLEISAGYLEVVLTTATIAFLLFLVEVARKLGLMARIAMIYNKSRDGDYSLKFCQCKAEDTQVYSCSSNCSSSNMLIGSPSAATISTIANTFSTALPNRKLVEWVRASLEVFGFIGGNAMLCTSFCCDELNRSLEHDLSQEFGDNFNIGGERS